MSIAYRDIQLQQQEVRMKEVEDEQMARQVKEEERKVCNSFCIRILQFVLQGITMEHDFFFPDCRAQAVSSAS